MRSSGLGSGTLASSILVLGRREEKRGSVLFLAPAMAHKALLSLSHAWICGLAELMFMEKALCYVCAQPC